MILDRGKSQRHFRNVDPDLLETGRDEQSAQLLGVPQGRRGLHFFEEIPVYMRLERGTHGLVERVRCGMRSHETGNGITVESKANLVAACA